MTVETGSGIWQLDPTLPLSSDDLTEGDDHIRLIKTFIQNTFENISATISVSATALNFTNGLKSNAQTQLDNLSKSVVNVITNIDTISTSLQSEISRTDTLSASFQAEVSRVDTLSASLQAEITRTDTLSQSLAGAISRIDALSQSLASLEQYGSMYVKDNSTASTATTSPQLMTVWDILGPSSGGVTVSTASGHFKVSNPGHYEVMAQFSFSGVANTTFDFYVYKNNEETDMKTARKIGSGGDIGSASILGIVSAVADDEINIRCDANAASAGFTIVDAQFFLQKVD